MDLNLATFTGPRAKLSGLLDAFATAGMPFTVEEAGGRFHVADAEGVPLLGPDGEPLFDQEPAVDVLCEDLDATVTTAAKSGFALRMHGPSGFDSLAEADAVAAGMHLPNAGAVLVETLRRAVEDPVLAAAVRDVLGGLG